MVWFNRILMLTLILCLSRTPVVWGHSHSGMDARQLALHLQKHHPATEEDERPKGWHWHVTHLQPPTDGATGPIPVAVLEERGGNSLTAPTPNAAHSPPSVPFEASASTGIARAYAVRQRMTYLRLNVLLI